MLYTKHDVDAAVTLYADAYLRYSDKNQDELSIEYQMEEVQEYAEKNGITVRNWYIDRAKSAKKVAGRDEFYNYIESVKDGSASPCLLVWRTNRAFRNAYESHIYRKMLRENGIKLISATQAIDEDTSSGRLVTNILADIDQYKSEEIGDHVKAASRSLVKRNPSVYMGQLPLFGYTVVPWRDGDALRQVYAIDETEAPIVRQIFADFIGGKSLYAIAEWMNEQDLKTRRGKAWSYQTLRELIRNDFYKGTRTYMRNSDDPIIIEGGVPAIIDPQTWERAQQQFRPANPGAGIKPRRQKSGNLYALTGRIKCAMCGTNICGKGGKDYRYYVCKNMEMRRNCTCKRIRKEMLEQYALEQIRLHILNEGMIDTITALAVKAYKAMPSAARSAQELNAQKEKLLRDLANLAQMKLDGDVAPEVYDMMKREKQTALAETEKELSVAERVPDAPTDAQIAAKAKALLQTVNAAHIQNGEVLKSLFDQFIESIVIDNNSVVITLLLSSTVFSHKHKNGSPIIALCQKSPISVLGSKRMPFAAWNRK